MPRLNGCGRRRKGLKHAKKKVPQSKENPSNPPASPGQTPTEDNPKDPPHPTKEPNPSINLDSGSNVRLDVSASSVDECCTQPTIE